MKLRYLAIPAIGAFGAPVLCYGWLNLVTSLYDSVHITPTAIAVAIVPALIGMAIGYLIARSVKI